MAQFHYKGSKLSSYIDVYSTGNYKFGWVFFIVVVVIIAEVHFLGWPWHWICLQRGFYLGFYHLFHITQIPQEYQVFENLGTPNLIPYVPSVFIADDVWLINNGWLSKLYIIPPLSSLLNTSITLILLNHSSFRRKFLNYNSDIFFSTENRVLSHPNLLSNNFCGDVKLDCIFHGKRWHWKQNGFRNHHNSNHYVPSWIS